MTFTHAEFEYLTAHPLGRLATIGPNGAPQAHPVAFWLHPDGRFVVMGGPELSKSQKFRNIKADPRVSLVVDDQSATPNPIGQTGRGIEIRGRALIVTTDPPLIPGFSPETFQLHPRRIITWNIEEFGTAGTPRLEHLQGYSARDVPTD
ncbi:pyridoxamine 5'-phosphate oxidase family protein [Nocardioides sp. YR527]|uniref:PPOX class F420-dependent oxidoreductase n=1 Tax=Nocardioides sp. YR527 TaxID=1881028 RepID=UPI000890184D|nr:PPOX class F420-dependent oxidoreductase [Nocardioides sp. YR527]SDJ73561.1 pyridoxamine 5'-phosphate oxidase family protein [Nocardioides sp. YR527]